MRRLVLALLLFVLAAPAIAGDGDLDGTFDGDGLWIATGGGSHNFTRGVRDPEGNLVIFGTRSSADQPYFHWRRILPSGAGPLCSHLPPGASNLHLGGIAFDHEGRLLLGGSLEVGTADPVVVVLRYLYPDCTLDDTLDGNGVVYHAVPVAGSQLVNVGGVETARWFEPPFIFRNRIVLPITLEVSFDRDLYWLRLLEDGSIDEEFGGGDGAVEVRSDRLGVRVARFGSGGYVISGSKDEVGQQPFVLEIDRDGELMTGFGTAGEHLLQVPDSSSQLDFLATGPDGRLAVGGRTSSGTDGFALNAWAAVLTAGGDLDTSFGGGDGWMLYRHGDADESVFRGAAFQGDRKLVLAGSSYDNVEDDAFAVRLAANGSLDPTFGAGGRVDLSFDDDPVGEDLGTGVVVSGDGRLWIAGSTDVETAPGESDYRPFAALLENRYIFCDGFEAGTRSNWSS